MLGKYIYKQVQGGQRSSASPDCVITKTMTVLSEYKSTQRKNLSPMLLLLITIII